MAGFNRLYPEPGRLSAEQAAAGFGPLGSTPEERPYVGLNMVATADGKATIAGRSGPIGNEADRELFHELRAQVDAVMVGAGTVRTERYGRLVRDPARRERRAARGLEPDPLAVVVSGRLDLPTDIPLLQAPEQRVVVITASASARPTSTTPATRAATASSGSVQRWPSYAARTACARSSARAARCSTRSSYARTSSTSCGCRSRRSSAPEAGRRS